MSIFYYNQERSDVMVLFTYTDYLRCKKALEQQALVVQEESTPYTPMPYCSFSVYHRHDKLYRDLLNNKKEFTLFLQDFFCYSLSSTIVKYNRNFITKDYSNTISDIIFKLKDIPVYLLVEHQSYPDHSLPYRIYRYYSSILEDSKPLEKSLTKADKIPLVTPIILYTGSGSWNFTPNIQDHQFDYTYNNKLKNGKLSLSYNFINIHDFSKEELLKMHSMIAFAMAIDKCEQVPELIDTIYDVYYVCSNEQKEYLHRMLTYLLKPIIPKKLYENLLKKFNNEEETYMEELIERMKRDLELRRIAATKEGRQEGIMKTAINMLKRNMPLEDISDITGLSIEELRKLKTA